MCIRDRYHAKMVSGRAAVATSPSALRPSRRPISPSFARAFVNKFHALGERSLHTGKVEGSIPSAPTIKVRILRALLFPISSLTTFQNGTKHEDDASSRGESVDFVLRLFCSDIGE